MQMSSSCTSSCKQLVNGNSSSSSLWPIGFTKSVALSLARTFVVPGLSF